MKIYIWYCKIDHAPSVVAAVARNVAQARRLLAKDGRAAECKGNPDEVHNAPCALVFGGD